MFRACLKRSARAFLVALILVLALAAAPQCAPSWAQGDVTLNIDRMESGPGDTMTAYVTVRDENGVPVAGLAPENFTIVEDQRTSFPPDSLGTQVNPRGELSVALVVDLSGTMRDQALAEARAASQQLLETLLNDPNDPDRAAFFGINGPVNINDLAVNEANQEIGFTNDRNKIINLLNTLQGTTGNATPLYDALFRVTKITARQQGARAIIVLTDGQDLRVSTLTADDPISEANRNNIPIFPIGFSKGKINDDYLTRLAARTGGAYTKAARADELTGLFKDILNRLAEQYVLTYATRLSRDASPHGVIIRVESPKGKAFDDEIFTFSGLPVGQPTAEQPPTPASQPAGAQTSAPEGTPAAADAVSGAATVVAVALVTPSQATGSTGEIPPAAQATPEPFPRNVITSLNNWVTDRDNLPFVIGILAALVLLVVLIVILILRRNRATQAPDEDYYRPEQPLPAMEPPTVGGAPSVRATDLPMADPRSAPGLAPRYPETSGPYAGTQFAGTEGATQSPPGPRPFGADAFGQPAGGPVEGGTVILPRGPQVQVGAILVDKKQVSRRYDVTASTDVGRAETNHVVLQNATVSRQHARIRQEKGKFYLVDLGSANGTFVNDQKITEPVALNDGDVVRFGEVEFLFKSLT